MLSGQKTDSILAVLLLLFSATNMKQAYGQFTRETINTVKFLLDHKTMESLDCTLYTPTSDEYKQKCPVSSLKCYATEVDVLLSEAGDTLKKFIRQLSRQLKSFNSTKKKVTHKGQSVPQHSPRERRTLQEDTEMCRCCESYGEQPPKVFLSTLQSILEQKNVEDEPTQSRRRKQKKRQRAS